MQNPSGMGKPARPSAARLAALRPDPIGIQCRRSRHRKDEFAPKVAFTDGVGDARHQVLLQKSGVARHRVDHGDLLDRETWK